MARIAEFTSITDHDLVDHLFPLHRPINSTVEELMDALREEFTELGHFIADTVPRGADQTVALRKLHEALMATIAAVACNQETYKAKDNDK